MNALRVILEYQDSWFRPDLAEKWESDDEVLYRTRKGAWVHCDVFGRHHSMEESQGVAWLMRHGHEPPPDSSDIVDDLEV